MAKRIRELDFDKIVAQVDRAVDRDNRKALDGLINADLSHIKSDKDALMLLGNKTARAAIEHRTSLGDLRIDQPLVQAVVRILQHIDAQPLASTLKMKSGEAAGPFLTQLAAKHKELEFDPMAIQAALIQGILEHGDHQLDERQAPWLMHWDEAHAAAYALFVLVTLRKLGLIPSDKWGYDVYKHDVEKFNRSYEENQAPKKPTN